MRRYCLPFLAILFAFAGSSGAARGQSETDLVFKFSVQGIETIADAKPIQYALMEHAFITSCNYVDECDCFKLSTSTPLDYVALKNLLLETGHQLTGEVLVSNGNVLLPPDPALAR